MKTVLHISNFPIAALSLAIGMCCAGTGWAADIAADGSVSAAASAPAPQQRVRDDLRMLMAELVAGGAFGAQAPQDLALSVDMPAQRVNNLGLVVGGAAADEPGAEVLAVTPASNAETIGLRAGDRLLALNGATLGQGNAAAAQLRNRIDALPDGAALAFQLQRGDRTLALAGTLSSVYVPAMRLQVGDVTPGAEADPAARAVTENAMAGCARISTFDVAPRQQSLHGAIVISIDGALPGPHGTTSYRVTPGHHVLQVAERIESRYLSFNDRLRNSSERYKTLTLDVPANTTTLVAARLIPDKSSEWQNGAYWEPVAWKQVAEACR